MLPEHLRNRYFEVGVLLACNRARLDAKRGFDRLVSKLETKEMLLPDWRVEFIGICALLRASIHLLSVDVQSCHNKRVKEELLEEWRSIKENREEHSIYWEFINKERNAILKEYKWSSYEQYFDEEGAELDMSAITLLTMPVSRTSVELRVKDGFFEGDKTLDLLANACDWVEERIVSAMERAGYKLSDRVHFWTWARMPKPDTKGPLV